MARTLLAPAPDLVVTSLGRERMIAALHDLYGAVEITDPPRIEGHWIVVPAAPVVVYRGLQRAAPDWVDLFVVARERYAKSLH